MKRFSIFMFLILLILSACSSAIKKEPIFYSENKKITIPLCPNKNILFIDPDDFSFGNSGAVVKHPPLLGNISDSLSDFGTIIGEIEVSYSGLTAYLLNSNSTYISDESISYFIVHDNNGRNLFLEQFRLQFGDQDYLKKCFKEKIYYSGSSSIKPFRIAGELDGLMVDIDLYNAQCNINNAILMPIKLKNTSSSNKTFNTSTDKISFFLNDAKSKKKIENEIYLYNYCSNSIISSIQVIRPGEEREYYAKADYKNVGIPLTLQFTNDLIDTLKIANRDKTFKKHTDTINALWGGDLQIGDKTI